MHKTPHCCHSGACARVRAAILFGQLPTLEIDGKTKLYQSKAIALYLAKEFGARLVSAATALSLLLTIRFVRTLLYTLWVLLNSPAQKRLCFVPRPVRRTFLLPTMRLVLEGKNLIYIVLMLKRPSRAFDLSQLTLRTFEREWEQSCSNRYRIHMHYRSYFVPNSMHSALWLWSRPSPEFQCCLLGAQVWPAQTTWRRRRYIFC